MVVTVNVIEDLGSCRYCADDFRTVDAAAGGDGPAVLTARVPGLGDRGGRADHGELSP
jgi:hypothetical protein